MPSQLEKRFVLLRQEFSKANSGLLSRDMKETARFGAHNVMANIRSLSGEVEIIPV